MIGAAWMGIAAVTLTGALGAACAMGDRGKPADTAGTVAAQGAGLVRHDSTTARASAESAATAASATPVDAAPPAAAPPRGGVVGMPMPMVRDTGSARRAAASRARATSGSDTMAAGLIQREQRRIAAEPRRFPKPRSAPLTEPAPSPGGTTSPAPTTGARADTGWTRVNAFMSYNSGTKTVRLELFAAYNTKQGGFNFNGGSNGSHTITVPQGWMVRAHVVNKDAIPHSAIIIKQQTPIPNAPDTPDIALAYTSHVTDGLQPMNGADDMTFRASPVGSYMLACGVPGHAPSGMWIRFVVSADATAPSYTM